MSVPLVFLEFVLSCLFFIACISGLHDVIVMGQSNGVLKCNMVTTAWKYLNVKRYNV